MVRNPLSVRFQVRAQMASMDSTVRVAATRQEVSLKADARCVEQALQLVAMQLDASMRMASQDVEKMRVALVKFLELSPDVRKAALSLGLQAAEPCLVRAEKGEWTEPRTPKPRSAVL